MEGQPKGLIDVPIGPYEEVEDAVEVLEELPFTGTLGP